MRSRSPSRRTPPPPPRISRRSPGSFRMRGKSPDRRRRMAPPPGVPVGSRSPPRSRDHRREFRHSPRRESYSYEQMIRTSQSPDFTFPRRSRSPLQRESKVRSYSPGKRKVSPPKRERERLRSRDPERERMRSRESDREHRPPRPVIPPPGKRTRSKSPEPTSVGPRDVSRMGSYGGPSEVSPARTYQGPVVPFPQTGPPASDRDDTNRTMSERFHSSGPGGFKKESDLPVFRGPEGTGFDINELKKITVDVRRNIPVGVDPIERTIINPEDVVLVRRPEMPLDEREFGMMHREGEPFRGRYDNEVLPPGSASWSASWEHETNHYVHTISKREGSRPIFARDEIVQASRINSGPVEEHRRVVAIVDEAPPLGTQGGLRSLPHSVDHDNGDYSRAGIAGASSRFESPARYSDPRPRSRDGYYPPPSEREAPPRDYSRSSREYDRSHGPPPSFEQRERSREDRFDRHSDDLRHELELRRRDEKYGHESRRYDYRGSDSGRSASDLRMRINEKRTDHHDDRESGRHRMMVEHYPDPMERDRERERERSHRGMMQPSPPGSERRRGPMPEFGHPAGDGRMHSSGGDGRMMHHGGPGDHNRQGPPERFHHEPPERFHYKSWDSNPEHVPKGRAYFEHDNRGEEFVRGRARAMMHRGSIMRGRGMLRGRPFRGAGPPPRGFMGRSGSRRGYSPRKPTRRTSPHWEHDLFDKFSADDPKRPSDNGHGK